MIWTSFIFSMVLAQSFPDPFLWLEDMNSAKSQSWVDAQNQVSTLKLTQDVNFPALRNHIMKVAYDQDKLPYPYARDQYVYSFWQDASNVQGIWRKMPTTEFLAKKENWETILDLDLLSKKESKTWVWSGAKCYQEKNCLISLSDAGSDSDEIREFDPITKTFTKDGFFVPAAKSDITWVDENHVLIATDFGPDSLTDSGYPRQVRIWKRGDALDQSKLILEAKKDELGVGLTRYHHGSNDLLVLTKSISFYEHQNWVFNPATYALTPIDIPTSAWIDSRYRDSLLVVTQEEWSDETRTIPGGSVLALPISNLSMTSAEVVFSPSKDTFYSNLAVTSEALYISVNQNVSNSLRRYERSASGWAHSEISLPQFGRLSLLGTDESQPYLFVAYQSFIHPPSLYAVQKGKQPFKVMEQTAHFDSSQFEVNQNWVTSKDGTRIPYFTVKKKGLSLNNQNPTLMYGYGGFNNSLEPWYLASYGELLNRGLVYVLANIRGGGEFGPEWHRSAILENKQRSYDDFIAVAEDLVTRGVTSAKNLAIQGGSNGGLLVGVAMTQRPDLFGAVLCSAPLLDMLRYHKLYAGASWVGEYGSPDDPKMRPILEAYSPYHNVSPDVTYPPILLETSKNDNRVHPGHARKMAALLMKYSNDVLYYEKQDGGHGGGASLDKIVEDRAMTQVFLLQTVF